MRSPKWSRDELILALELYFRVNPLYNSGKHPEIVRLSEILNSLPLHPQAAHGIKFRNPSGVYMKLCNYLRLDPSYKGAGLTRGGKFEEIIWKEFANDTERLKRTANSIIAATPKVSFIRDGEETTMEDEEYPEGRLLTQLHKKRERNPSIAKKKKKKALQEKGKLACEICGFDFQQVYGDLGKGFAECHHRLPLSDLPYVKGTKISDLAIVCSNCHRMLHRSRPWRTVAELRVIFSDNCH